MSIVLVIVENKNLLVWLRNKKTLKNMKASCADIINFMIMKFMILKDEEEDYDNESQVYMIRKLLLTLRVTKDLQ